MYDERTELIHVSIPGSSHDPRDRREPPPGVVFHYVPEFHPDDVTVHRGIPVTSVARTLVDCAEDATPDELRGMFARAYEQGILDLDAVDACLQRIEWRPSLPLVRRVLEEFRGLVEAIEEGPGSGC
ncbi:hypothetical protein DSM112329_04880 [Paraconexibacter sp. AEG42_29]|uniref:Uncharacterized protein n=1 Tax=Paraconexibacter sp. AEG42_29 TaxID=2997339 RepID=A0AAU7B290_9ACTN